MDISFFIITFISLNNKEIMDYKMKELGGVVPFGRLRDMYETIMRYIRGKCAFGLTERARQYFTWGAKSFMYVTAKDGCYGIQFRVSGMLHKGRVRIYYNPGSDYFDVELLRAIKDEVVWSCEDLDFEQLHNVLHQHIERKDDPEV